MLGLGQTLLRLSDNKLVPLTIMTSHKYYYIWFHQFRGIFCCDAPEDLLVKAKIMRDNMSLDEYAGYSPEEQEKHAKVSELLKDYIVEYEEI